MHLLDRLLHPAPPPPVDELLHWSEEFSVGNPLLDNEHRDIAAMLNELYRHQRLGNGHALDCRRLLTRLHDTMHTHCANEEAVLARHRCPRQDDHHAEHTAILAELAGLERTLPAMDAVAAEQALASMVRRIVLNHILVTDMRDQDYLRE